MYIMLLAVVLLAGASGSAAEEEHELAHCSEDWQGCFDSKCCSSWSYQCYRRPNVDYAQCRPRHDGGGALACEDTEAWLCPGWQDNVADWGNCFDPASGRACMSPDFGCFKRRGVEFAQCRPLIDAAAGRGNCTDTDEWRCPG